MRHGLNRGISRTQAIIVAVVAIIVVIAGVGGYYLLWAPKPTEEHIRVGLVLPSTGGGALTAKDYRDIYEFTAKMFNDEGGIKSGPLKGMKVELIFADSQSSPEVAASEAARLITEEKVHVLVGGLWSSLATTIGGEAERYKIPYFVDACSSPSLTTHGWKYFFRPGISDAHCMRDVVKLFNDLQVKTGVEIKKVAIVWVDDPFGKGGRDYAIRYLEESEKYEYEIVADLPVPPSPTDVSVEALTLKEKEPDAIIIGVHDVGAILFQKAFNTYDINPKIIVCYDTEHFSDEYLEAVGDLTDGVCGKAAWNWDIKKPIVEKIDGLFYDEYGHHIREGRAWLALITALKIIEKTGSLDPEKIRQTAVDIHISKEELLTSYGVDFYGSDEIEPGQNKLAETIFVQFFGTEYYTVWPFDTASKEIKFPLPTWEERE